MRLTRRLTPLIAVLVTALAVSGVFAIGLQVPTAQFEDKRGISMTNIDDMAKTSGTYESGSLAMFGTVSGIHRLSLGIEGVDFKGSPATATITTTVGGVSYTVSATQRQFANPGEVFSNSRVFDLVDLDGSLTYEVAVTFDPAFLDEGVAIAEVKLERYQPSPTNQALGAGLVLSGVGIGLATGWLFLRRRSASSAVPTTEGSTLGG